jgi:hypothetical protein
MLVNWRYYGVCAVPRAELQRRIRATALEGIKQIDSTICDLKISGLCRTAEFADGPDLCSHICQSMPKKEKQS